MKEFDVDKVAKIFANAIHKAVENMTLDEIKQIDWFTYKRD